MCIGDKWINCEYDSKNGTTNSDFSCKKSIGSSKNLQVNKLNNTKFLENKLKLSKKSEILVSYAVSVDISTKTAEYGKSISNYYKSL